MVQKIGKGRGFLIRIGFITRSVKRRKDSRNMYGKRNNGARQDSQEARTLPIIRLAG